MIVILIHEYFESFINVQLWLILSSLNINKSYYNNMVYAENIRSTCLQFLVPVLAVSVSSPSGFDLFLFLINPHEIDHSYFDTQTQQR